MFLIISNLYLDDSESYNINYFLAISISNINYIYLVFINYIKNI